MKFRIPTKYAVFLAAVGLIAAQFYATKLLLDRARDTQIHAAEQSVLRVLRASDSAVNRSFVQIDSMLAGLPTILSQISGGVNRDTIDLRVLSRSLQSFISQNFSYRDILIVGRNGLVLAAALPVSLRQPLPFDSHLLNITNDGRSPLSIIGPVLNPTTGERSLFFARRATIAPLGEVHLVAELPISVIQSLLSATGEGEGIGITIERADGQLLVAFPHDEFRIGTHLTQPIQIRAGGQTGPVILTQSRFYEAQEVLSAVRPTLYEGIAIEVTLKIEAALAPWRQDNSRALWVSSILAMMILLVAATLIAVLHQKDQVEAERVKSKRLLDNAIESMSDGFVMFDHNDRLVAYNSIYLSFYKASQDFIKPGALFDDIIREGAKVGQYPQAGPDIDQFVKESKLYHLGNSTPMERLLPDGRWVLITERRTPDGGTVGIRTDITAIKQAMSDLSDARDAARRAVEVKSKFFARMSHELRTPLNGIIGFTNLLLSDPDLTASPTQREQLENIDQAGTHLMELVNDLLDLAKLESGDMRLSPHPFLLHETIKSCVDLMKPEVARKKQDFTAHIDPMLPKSILCDAKRLRQIILNFLSNAIKFTPSQGSIRLTASHPSAGRMKVEVMDTGPGIPLEQQTLIFRDFVQLEAGTKADVPGTGLGLAITARLVRQLGGEVGLSSAPGEGATFWFEIPITPIALSEAPSAEAALKTTGEDLPRLRVLVVDDVKANRDVAGAILKRAGQTVSFASDGSDALEIIAEQSFDLVFMDLQMPGIDGLEATRHIRAMPPPKGQIPIVALTASVSPEHIEAAQNVGMNDHLGKPLNTQALLNMIRQFAPTTGKQDLSHQAEPSSVHEAASLPTIERDKLELLHSELGAATHEIVREFLKEMAQIKGDFQAILDAGTSSPEELRALSHRLIGSSRTLGTTSLTDCLERFQTQIKQADLFNQTPIEDWLRKIIASTDAAMAAATQVLSELDRLS
jgi:signal transduction histidine kinase/DNA-binding response OmpR family regulator